MPPAPFRLLSACAGSPRSWAIALALSAAACTLDKVGTGPAPGPDAGGSGGIGGATSSTSGTGGDGGTILSTCGNNIPEEGESCDDGNSVPGDGCSPDCKREKPDICPGVAITLAPTTTGIAIYNDTSGATNDTGDALCGGDNARDMVYQIT